MELLRSIIALLVSVATISAFPTFTSRQTDGTHIVVAGGGGGLDWRKEVHSLKEDTDQWNIYLLGLQKFQQMDASDPMSWYQIAGIHGLPFTPWDGVEQCSNCTASGYCTHQSTLFPTWHRAYLALFEQSLLANAMDAANEFAGDDKTRYVKAATQLRLPYWDWAQPPANGEAPFPAIFTDNMVTVNTPTGSQQISNPLLQYTLNGDSSFLGHSTTQRNPTFTVQNRQQLRSDLWTVLTSTQSYNSFSSEVLIPGQSNNPTSLESVHDQVHILAGGDMTNLDVAAFDPVFWLHHAMIDHVLDLYFANNPYNFLQPWNEVGHTMTYATGTMEDASSDLTPFHSSASGDFWTSNDIKMTHTYNYVYDDIASGKSAVDIVNSLYRDSGETPIAKRSILDTQSTLGRYISKGVDFAEAKLLNEYVASIQADSMGTDGSFTVFLFDGSFDESDPSGWYEEEHLIGTHGFFTSLNAMGDGSALVNAGISLTGSIAEAILKGYLRDLSNDAVTAYLKQNLKWRITKASDGSVMDASQVPGLEVAIVTADVDMPTEAGSLPTWSAFRPLTEITQDRQNGYRGGRWD